MTQRQTMRSALWRRRLLAGVLVAALHAGFFALIASDWARHLRPMRQDTVSLTLERSETPPPRPDEPEPAKTEPGPPPPPPPPIAQATGPTSQLSARPSAPADGVEPLIAGNAGAPSGDRPGPINMGCLTPNLPKRQRDECDRQRLVATLDKPDPRLGNLKPTRPPGRGDPKPLTPGLHYTPPFGLKLVVSPNDKGFPPGMGDTKTTVFDPEEVTFLPTPR